MPASGEELGTVIDRDGFPLTVQLGQVATLLSGGTPSKANSSFWNGDIPWLTPKDMGQWEGRTDAHVTKAAIGKGTRLAPENASFVAVRGMSLHNEIRVVRSARPISFNQDIKAVVAGPSIDPAFLYYALTAAKPVLLGLVSAAGHGTGVLDTDRLRSLEIPALPVAEQRTIAETIGAIDDKIELNRRMNETLEGMAQAIFRDWFVDFGPVRRKIALQGSAGRKAAGEADPVAIMGGLTPDPARATELAALFPAALGDDGLPVGWTLAPLSDLFVLQRGFDLPKTTRTDGAFPVIAASGPSGTHNAFKVKAPGVCTGRSGVLGGVYYVETDFWPLNTSLWIKDYPGSSPLHAFHLLRGIDLAGFNAGSAVPTLNRNHVHGLPTVKPPIAVVHAFDALVGPFYAKMAAGDGENVTLAETRDYLLPRLMSGAVRVVPKVEAA